MPTVPPQGSGGTVGIAGGNTFARVIKKADEIVNNSATLQDDDELFVALPANKIYLFALFLYGRGNTSADMKQAFTIPSGAVGDRLDGNWTSQGPFDNVVNITTTNVLGTSNTTDGQIALYGRVVMAGTAGNLQMQWAQNVATVGDTTVLKGSTLIVWEETA